MKKKFREFYSRVKREIFNCSSIKNYHDNLWYPNFDFDVQYHNNFIKIFFNYLKNYNRFKKIFDTDSCAQVYNMLCDEYSKDIYLKVLCFWVFNDNRCGFPFMYNKGLSDFGWKYDYLIIDDTEIEITNGTLRKYDLNKLNKNIKIIFGNKLAFYMAFILEQYNYKDKILPREGDTVIDGGACYGDSALFFADKMSGKGKIYSFDFVEKNLGIFQQNLELNPTYKNIIEVVQKALSDKQETFYTVENASMSFIEKEQKTNSQKVESTSIDDFVLEKNLDKIDFIKLDIEGFEQQAIIGAINSIKKFKPRLAICLYHKKEDLWQIPLMIKQIEPKYKFYLDHYTINSEETVLYGICD